MDQHTEGTMNTREIIKGKLRECFDGKIVRKDLTKKIKEGANVPVYVLEFLLGQYCSSDDEEVIEKGVENVKRILADNFVRPDEAQKILSVLRARGSYTVIDKITVSLNIKRDVYEAEFSNLGLKAVPNALQVCLDSGAKKVLLPITSAADLGTVPADLIGCFNLIFYSSAEDAVFKALGVE